MEISSLQLAVLLLTIGVVLASGLYAARSIHSAEGFSLNGRHAGVPLVAGTIAGTCVGGGATVGTAQLAYSRALGLVVHHRHRPLTRPHGLFLCAAAQTHLA